ncbi:MAG: hypothetical protein ACJLUP_00200 [Agrobacterium tumefaciens]
MKELQRASASHPDILLVRADRCDPAELSAASSRCSATCVKAAVIQALDVAEHLRRADGLPQGRPRQRGSGRLRHRAGTQAASGCLGRGLQSHPHT